MRKERLFYLDFIRAIATISIIMTHFNARYIYAGAQYIYKAIISTTFFNIYIGDWGVSLFFIISGAALMYVYQEKLEYKRFYKKRFESLYPMFWMAYIIAFIGLFYLNKGMFLQAPKKNFILTIIGFDGYLAANVPTFYILGEWFLGCIILFYVLFPLLRTGVNKYPKATVVVTAMIYLTFIFFYHGVFDMSKIVFVRMPEFLMGMYFIKYIKKVNLPMLVTSIIVLALNLILKPQWSNHLQTTYVGISSFFILVYISKYFDGYPVYTFVVTTDDILPDSDSVDDEMTVEISFKLVPAIPTDSSQPKYKIDWNRVAEVSVSVAAIVILSLAFAGGTYLVAMQAFFVAQKILIPA